MELEQKLSLLGNDRIKVIQEYLRYYKFQLMEESFSKTQEVKDMIFTDGCLKVINNIITTLQKAKKRESYVNLITGQIEHVGEAKNKETK